jgi:hypothetical protein
LFVITQYLGTNQDNFLVSSPSKNSLCNNSECGISKIIISKSQLEFPDARYIGNLKLDHFNTPSRAKRHIDMIKIYAEKQRGVIKKVKRQNERALNKIKNMDSLLDNLHELNLLSLDRHDTILVKYKNILKVAIIILTITILELNT